MFNKATDFTIHHSQFTENHFHGSQESGLGRLYDASLPDATYDSAASEFAEVPLPVNQYEGIVKMLGNLVGRPEDPLHVVMMTGPKSMLAQTCAETLEEQLCASFFISRRLQTDDPARFFTTIAYQLATHFHPYASLLETKLRRNPSLVRKSLVVQFDELITKPFRELLAQGSSLDLQRRLIIINGLDEYANVQARSKILQIILRSAGKLPFLWLIFSQPDKTLDARLVEMESSARLFWKDGDYPPEVIAFPGGSVCGAVLLSPQQGNITGLYRHQVTFQNSGFFFFFTTSQSAMYPYISGS